MPRKTLQYDDYGSVLREINLSSDNDYLDQLIPILKDAILSNSTSIFQRNLSQYANELDSDIETIGLTKHDEFLKSVNQLQNLREGTVALTKEILQLNQSIQESTENLSEQKRALVDTTAIRQNITDASEALKQSLKILHAVNLAHELIRKKQYYGALKALDDLQIEHLIPAIQNKYATQLKLAILIQESIPLSRKAISEAVMSDLNTWLYRIRETSQFLGEVAFYHTELRRTRQKERLKSNPLLGKFKLNSAIELVFDETEEFDVLDNEELQVDFTPLFECMHIHEALGQGDKFKTQYATTRKQQKELLLPNSVSLVDDDEKSFSGLLESIAGFAIIEKATLRKAQNLRSQVDVDELWDSMCQTAINLISKALDEVADAELLLKIKGVVALFIQTMEGWGYSIISLDNFLLTLFEKYAAILQKRFSDDFLEIVLNDDYMPMPVSNIDEYDKVVNVSWFKPDKPREELTFPCVFPFSQIDDHFQHPSIIDDTLKRSLDLLLSENVCNSLVERLSVQYLSQIVQILINLEHFETACLELEQLLMAARSSTNPGGPIVLSATEKFRSNKKTAEKRIFELVNSKIDDLVETAEYDWVAQTLSPEPSNYMQTLTTYLSNIMSSTLLGLPPSIKELIYFDALSHATTSILSLPLSPQVKAINPNGVAALATDVSYLEEFVSTLPNALLLKDGLDELLQVVALMKLDSPDEFYDLAVRNRKFGRVDPIVGTNILSKLTHTVQSLKPVDTTSAATRLGGFGSSVIFIKRILELKLCLIQLKELRVNLQLYRSRNIPAIFEIIIQEKETSNSIA